MRRIAATLALLALAACVPAAPAPPPASGAGQSAGPALRVRAADTCGAAARSALMGQKANALERVYILGPVRLIRPGDVLPADHIDRRINFELDAEDRIAGIFCG